MSKYEHYCLFGEPWWLDIVAGPENWDDVRIEFQGSLIARIPYVKRKIKGMNVLGMPPLTQCLGPYFSPAKSNYAKMLGKQKNFVEELLSKLPNYQIFRQNFHHEVTNILPWYWNGFQQTTLFTYVIEDLSNEETIWKGMLSNIRSDIRKAKNRFNLEISTQLGAEVLINLCKKTFSRQNKYNVKSNLIRKIYEACEKRGSGKGYFAIDPKGRVHAGVFVVWDERATYYLLGGGDPDLRNSGAHSLILWEAIKNATKVSKSFDFEGSMVESIERYFRAFGAKQMPYSKICKVKNRWLKSGILLKDAIKSATKFGNIE